MPTTIYAKHNAVGNIGFDGNHYELVDGAVDVPDHAVSVLTESHDFTREKPEYAVQKSNNGNDDSDDFKLENLTKNQLLEFAKDSLGLALKSAMSKEEIYAEVEAALLAKKVGGDELASETGNE